MTHEQRQILESFSQWWKFNEEHIEAIVQVQTKLSVGHRRSRLEIGCGYHAEDDRSRPIAPQWHNLLVLQYPEQRRLHVEWQVRQFVEEQGAPVGQFDLAPFAASRRAAECTLIVTEKLGSQQFLGNRAQIQRNKRPMRTHSRVVDRLRE